VVTAPSTNLLRAVALACATLAPNAAQAQAAQGPVRVVLDRSLGEHEGRVVSIDAAGVVVEDEAGRRTTIPRAQVLAVLTRMVDTIDTPGQARAPGSPSQSWLDLVDRQAWPGRLATSPGGEDRISWESAWGLRTFATERVLSVRLHAASTLPAPEGASDRVILRNGDTADGFVSEVGPTIRIERDGRESLIPSDRAAGILFANPPEEPRGLYAWHQRGSVVAILDPVLTPAGEFTARLAEDPTGAPATGPWHEFRAVLFDASRLRALALLPIAGVGPAPGASRRWTPPPQVGDAPDAPLFAADVELPGPMSVDWDLPQGAAHLAATAELPVAARTWGDCEVLVGVPEQPALWRQRLRGEAPTASIRVALPPGAARLRVTVEPGENGPVQDRVILRRPIILVEPPR
jgi:hypothetical protein